jgi:hypothetical protein
MDQYASHDNLEQSLQNGDEHLVVAALKKAKKVARRRHLGLILDILKTTHSSRLRNAAAIAVADLDSSDAKKTLIHLLVRKDTKKSRGTLLYALDEAGVSIPIDILIQVITTSRFEAREEAIRFLQRRKVVWKPERLEDSMEQLQRMTASRNIERSQVAKKALHLASALGRTRGASANRRRQVMSVKIK